MSGEISYAAAFVAGVSGSMHCLAMCGGLSGALGMRARSVGKSAAGAFAHSALYQLGRLASYALAGAVVGALGGVLMQAMNIKDWTRWLRVAAGVVMILLGLQLMFGWRLLAPVERAGARLWQCLAPLSKRLPDAGWPQALLLGALWGWLPCGLVYSMLLLGVLGGSAAHGASLMLAFGVGTLPAMFSATLLSAQLQRVLTLKGWRVAAGMLMMLFGSWTIRAVFGH